MLEFLNYLVPVHVFICFCSLTMFIQPFLTLGDLSNIDRLAKRKVHTCVPWILWQDHIVCR